MQEVRAAIVTRLTNDTALYPTLVPGGVYDRPLKTGTGQGATPAAFWINPSDPARIVRLRESIVVLGPNEVSPPNGPVGVEDLFSLNGFLRLFYYVPATATGKAALDQIDMRVWQLLEGWQTSLTGLGTTLTVKMVDMTEPLEDQQFEGSLACYRRVVGEYLRAAA